jgi:ABC-type antimicrobial peptide transport system permease subunit
MLGIVSGLLNSGISLGTADILAYLMFAVAVFLVASAVIAYIFLRKNKRETPTPSVSPA